MDAELVKVEPVQVVRQAGRTMITREQLTAEVEQRRLLGEYVDTCMKEGTDYGKIPGTDKPTLLKPGAEKLMALFYCSPEFALVPEFSREDFEQGFFKYTFRCRVLGQHGGVVAEGYGSANSREARYRWRDGKRKCPDCGKDVALNKSKPPRTGFYCWDKKGGCGSTFEASDKRITEQQVGRVENPDIADLDNTVLKMAKKRALVDGAIALARCSDMFTQDVEDLAPQDEHREAAAPRRVEEPLSPVEAPAPKPTGPVTVAFGPYKGKTTRELHDDELRETIELAHTKLEEQPKAKWAKAMRENLAALLFEQVKRENEPKKKERVPLTPEQAEQEWKRRRETKLVGFGDLGGKTLAALADDEVTMAAEHIQDLLKRPEPMMAAAAAKDMLLMLGLELEHRFQKAAQDEKAEAKRNLEA